jgi:putative endonuclease
MWTVYIIQHSTSKTIYIGVTSNLIQRIKQHNSNKNYSTRRKTGSWILVCAEAYRNKEDAFQREARLKQRGRAKQELLKRASRSLLN